MALFTIPEHDTPVVVTETGLWEAVVTGLHGT
jgi:hypothetical protein